MAGSCCALQDEELAALGVSRLARVGQALMDRARQLLAGRFDAGARCQGLSVAQLGQLFFQCQRPLARFYLGSDIPLNANEVRQLVSVVEYRGDRQFVPEQAAVLAVVAQGYPARLVRLDGVAQLLKGFLVAVVSLQKTVILVEDFIGAVAGQCLECRVDVNEDVVVAFLFGDHDAVVDVDDELQQLGVDHSTPAWILAIYSSPLMSSNQAPCPALRHNGRPVK